MIDSSLSTLDRSLSFAAFIAVFIAAYGCRFFYRFARPTCANVKHSREA
jgi:hypothetical protein